MKVLGTMQSRKDIITYLNKHERAYKLMSSDYDYLRFAPQKDAWGIDERLTIYFDEDGCVNSIFQLLETPVNEYKALQYRPHSKYFNKLEISRHLYW